MNLKKTKYVNNTARPALRMTGMAVAVAAALAAGNASATTEFEFGDGWQGNWTTTVSAGKSWRTLNPDYRLVTPGNAALTRVAAVARLVRPLMKGT